MKYADIFGTSTNRYAPRKSVVDAATSDANTKAERGALSTNIPKPNVVRIEVLPASVRREYLGSFYSIFDRVRQATVNGNIASDAYLPFYGIMSSGADPSFGVSAKWQKATEGGFAGAVKLLKAIPGVNQLSNFVDNIPVVGGAINAAKNVAKVGVELAQQAGITSQGIGTSTLKSFTQGSVDIGYSISVQWYLPEQEAQCMIGMDRLIRMTYLRAFNNSEGEGGIATAVTGMVTDLIKSYNTTTAGDADKTASEKQQFIDKAKELAGQVTDQTVTTDTIKNFLDKYTGNFWGTHYAIAPLPVRLTIGHTLDIQPMVITNVKFTTSSEQFISTLCGAHLPVFVTAKIDLTPWLIPSPGQEYMSFLGHEVFGNREK